jgi:hypothetical protein
MRVKAYITFKGKFGLTYIGRIGKNGVFKFRNNQLRKACLNGLRNIFCYDCPGGSLTIPDLNRRTKYIIDRDKYVTCYHSVIPRKEDKKHIVTYWK